MESSSTLICKNEMQIISFRTMVSSSEEDKEEKLLEGMCGVGKGSVGGNLCESAIRTLVFITSSPSGQPLRMSWSYKISIKIKTKRQAKEAMLVVQSVNL